LQLAYEKYPERFVKGLPKPPQLPEAVWINPPERSTQELPRPNEHIFAEPLSSAGAFSQDWGAVKCSLCLLEKAPVPVLDERTEEYDCPQDVIQLDCLTLLLERKL